MQMSNHCSQIMMLRSKLKTKLDPMRYEHSLSVSFTCMNLAMRYGYDIDKAELAGLMHDCGKRFTDEIILKKCISHKILVTDAEQKALPVLHAKYGAWLAENKYGIEDPEIISAIACHTTGKADMSVLDKIVYIADYIEPRRYKADNLPQMRKLAYEDLDKTMYEILKGTLDYLNKKGSSIDPMTMQAYQYFESIMEQKKQTEMRRRTHEGQRSGKENDRRDRPAGRRDGKYQHGDALFHPHPLYAQRGEESRRERLGKRRGCFGGTVESRTAAGHHRPESRSHL